MVLGTGTPGAPVISSPTGNTLNVANNAADSTTAYFAFRINGGCYTNQYLKADGTVGATPVWQTKATWGTKTITGLWQGTTYLIDAQATDNASGACPGGFGYASSGTTLACESNRVLNGGFGSKVTVPGTGMLLNNCMHLMDPNPGRTNSIAPGKRILSSMSPTIVLKDGQPFIALGTPGGVRIFGSVMQAIVNVIDHGMTLQQAVEAPRLWDRGSILEVEQGFDDLSGLTAELERRGHVVETPFKVAGGMNGIMLDAQTGVLRGAACWRADGAPMGYSGGDGLVEGDAGNAMWA